MRWSERPPAVRSHFAALNPGVIVGQRSAHDSNDAIKTKLKQIEDEWAKAAMDKDHGAASKQSRLR